MRQSQNKEANGQQTSKLKTQGGQASQARYQTAPGHRRKAGTDRDWNRLCTRPFDVSQMPAIYIRQEWQGGRGYFG